MRNSFFMIGKGILLKFFISSLKIILGSVGLKSNSQKKRVIPLLGRIPSKHSYTVFGALISI